MTTVDAVVLRIEGELTIYRAAELKQTLLAAVAANPAVEVDLSQVSEFDSAGLQLLLLAKREAGAAGRTLRLVDHSPAVVEVLELFDLAAHFGDPLVVGSASISSRAA
ncbi:STAS domain-containing protein [Rhizobacter sp. SG703]|uniref:STAS domain-containing protein n=1 Tax=Rhizobacter sp. SG703 TaxID=2587140 RepID=UPI0014463CB0|nr:STAS domain-containing protein [Rhizobacter sp. SG703]NKI97315.1 anti-anti-sigma factor [Rhizobacter sp. SG703]